MNHYSRAQWTEIAEKILGERIAGRPEQGVLEISAAQNYALGARREIGLCVYRYGQAGAVALGLGELCQSPVPDAAQIDLVPSASYAIGVRVIEVTLGAAAVTANEYAGGWLYVNDGTGQGQKLRILSHPAAAASATCVFTCLDALTIALDTADSLLSLVANPWSGAIIHPSPPTAGLVGVPNLIIPIANFGWFQTRGPCPVLIDGTVYIYQQVRPSASVDGAVAHAIQEITVGAEEAIGTKMAKITDSGGAASVGAITGTDAGYGGATIDIGSLQTIVGRVMRVNTDTDYGLVFLALE